MNISIVGPGKVGTTLALALRRKGFHIASVIGRTKTRARHCAELVSCDRYSHRSADIHPQTDLLVLATPDSVIKAVAEEAARHTSLRFNRLKVFHVSGVLTSDVLSPLTERGALCFSLHPIQTFAGGRTPTERPLSLKGISYGFEGASRAERFARRLVRELDGKLLVIPKEEKILYHIACVFASNYLLTALQPAEEIGDRLKWKTLAPFGALITQTIANAQDPDVAQALTGPIVRGDVDTVKAHIHELRRSCPELLPLYRELGLRTAIIAQRTRRNRRKELASIRKILSQRP